MLSTSHRSDHARELLYLDPLGRQQWHALEERNHRLQQGTSFPNNKDKGTIFLAVRLDVAATKPFADELENFRALVVLAYPKLGHELKADAAAWVALHRDGEASFTVDVTGDVCIEGCIRVIHVATSVNDRTDAAGKTKGRFRGP